MKKLRNRLKDIYLSVSLLLCFFSVSCSYVFTKSTVVDLDGKKIHLYNVGTNPQIIKNNDDVFVISLSKDIIKLSTRDKSISWVKSINTVPENNFVFDEDNIYFNGINNNFYILDYETGDIVYIYINSNVNTINNIKKPIIYDDKIVVFFNDNRVVIFNKISKKVLFDRQYNGDFTEKIDNGVLKINDESIDLDRL